MKVRMTAALATVAFLLVGCSSAPAVTGEIRDPYITNRADCNSNGTQEVDLTNAAGSVIARENVRYTWDGKACGLPFGFTSNVPSLPGYGLREPGIGRVWLTPKQIQQPIKLTSTLWNGLVR